MSLIQRLGAVGAILSLVLSGTLAAAAPPLHAGTSASQGVLKVYRPKLATPPPRPPQKIGPLHHHH